MKQQKNESIIKDESESKEETNIAPLIGEDLRRLI